MAEAPVITAMVPMLEAQNSPIPIAMMTFSTMLPSFSFMV